MKKSCPACLKLVKKSFTAFKVDVPDILKTVQPPFIYAQADIFGPILAIHGFQLYFVTTVVLFILNFSTPTEQRVFPGVSRELLPQEELLVSSGLMLVLASPNLVRMSFKRR